MSVVTGIQGHLLEVTVVGCNRLKDTEWISRQDPYVCLEYGGNKFRTRTCTDGGKNPTFQEKFIFTLIEGLRELSVSVWNSNTLTYDDFIGSGKVQLHKVLSQGFDDTAWPLQTKTGRHAGEVRLILHFPNANRPGTTFAPSAPPYMAPAAPQGAVYGAVPHAATYPPTMPYSTASPYSTYPPNPATYPPSPFQPPQPVAYPPQSHIYPPVTYPPQPYPPPPQATPYYPPGPYPGYPPPPY
ncbi:C2 calcium-dependent membrane targeting [Macleaya cordata]|uniref:C2 calcium-dependent membrane targeting n=1 Tax=Macleaya cordata TaxID=56857 RepID=A0A200PV28_MACCD|nr:C2 calcium-dependent membrane targeting [Macleaya cordata]